MNVQPSDDEVDDTDNYWMEGLINEILINGINSFEWLLIKAVFRFM